jgi:hypothetical protein
MAADDGLVRGLPTTPAVISSPIAYLARHVPRSLGPGIMVPTVGARRS